MKYGTTAGALTSARSVVGLSASHSVVLPGLSAATTYFYRVVSVDAAGLVGVGPLESVTTGPIPSAFTVVDTTAAHFQAGTSSTTRVATTGDGEVELTSAVGSGFDGTELPADWTATPWATGGSAVVSDGRLTADGVLVATDGLFAPGRSLEFAATFSGEPFQHVGLAVTFNEARWAIFSTASGGALYARTHTGGVPIDTLLPGSWLNAPHRFRIDWNAATVVFSIDGAVVSTHDAVIADVMRPVVSDFALGGQSVIVDSMDLTPPFRTSGVFASRVLDAGTSASWTSANWTASQPTGGGTTLAARFGDTAQPDATWTPFQPVASSGAALSAVSRYAQYQATLTSDGEATPALADVTFNASPGTPGLSASDAVVVEGNSGTSALVFTATLPWPTTGEVRVDYVTAPGTATAGSDFVSTSGTAIIPAGATSATVTVAVTADTALEPDETVLLNLSTPVGAVILDGQGVGTIMNDDQPILSVAGATVSETAGAATFVATLSAPTVQTVQAALTTTAGTAVNGADFQSVTTTVTLPPGVTTVSVPVAIMNDDIDELDETFTVSLSNATGATLGAFTVTGTIVDDDPTPSLSIGDVR